MLHPRPVWFALVLETLVPPNTAVAQDDDLRIIEFETYRAGHTMQQSYSESRRRAINAHFELN